MLENSSIPFQLPIGAGQLSVFGNDGTIIENDIYLNHVTEMKNVPEMVALIMQKDLYYDKKAQLERECRIFTKYLISQSPNDYVIDKYYEANIKSAELSHAPADRFQRILLSIAVKSFFMTSFVDSYASIFLKDSLFRKKLILLLAILENSPPFYAKFDYPDSSNSFHIFLTFGLHGIWLAFSLILSIILFTPLYFVLKIVRK